MSNIKHHNTVYFLILSILLTMMAGCTGQQTPTVKTMASSAGIQSQVRKEHTNVVPRSFFAGAASNQFSKTFLALQKKYRLAAVPTYDGLNQSTHPKLLYFPKGWNGYQYWMSVTPYPYGNDDYENPCIVVSNDEKTWVTPPGLKNPVIGAPRDVQIGGHYSDSHLVMRGNVMELWYRYNRGNPKNSCPDASMDYYFRTTSTDGIHWSESQPMQQSGAGLISLVVNYQNNKYRFWYTTAQNKLMYAESTNGVLWQNQQQCIIELPKGYLPWHQDLIRYQDEYYLLQTGIRSQDYSFALFLSRSADGVHFTKGVPFYPSDHPDILNKSWLYRSTVYADGDQLKMMISYRLPQKRWYLAPASVSVKQWKNACDTRKPLILSQDFGTQTTIQTKRPNVLSVLP